MSSLNYSICRPGISFWLMRGGGCNLGQSFWMYYFSSRVDNNFHGKNSAITFNGKFWSSDDVISYPKAIMDDFGMLVPVV